MKNIKLEFKWALIFVLVALVWMVLEKVMGLHSTRIESHPTLTNLFIIPAIVVYWLALKAKKNTLSGNISFKQAFISGLIISVIVTAFTPLSQYITHKVISPEYLGNAKAYAISSRQSTREEAEAFFSMKNYILQSLLFAPIAGVITTALVAWLVSRKKKG